MSITLQDIVSIRKKILSYRVLYKKTDKVYYNDAVKLSLSFIDTKMYSVLYNFFLKASMLNMLEDYLYTNNQHDVKNFLRYEITEAFKIIKIFLIMILDCSCSRLPLAAQELIFTKEYINNFSINHIVYILSIIKEDINFFDIHKNPYVISKKVLLDVIEMYRLLEYSDSTNLRVVAVSKTLNLWHCRGKIFCKRSTTNEDNPAAIFTKTQLSKLSNITPSEVDREIKKLIYSY